MVIFEVVLPVFRGSCSAVLEVDDLKSGTTSSNRLWLVSIEGAAELMPVIGEQSLLTSSTHPVLKTCFDVGKFETPTTGWGAVVAEQQGQQTVSVIRRDSAYAVIPGPRHPAALVLLRSRRWRLLSRGPVDQA